MVVRHGRGRNDHEVSESIRRAKEYGKLLKAEGLTSTVQQKALDEAEKKKQDIHYADRPWLKKKHAAAQQGDVESQKTQSKVELRRERRAVKRGLLPKAPQTDDDRSKAIAAAKQRRNEHGRTINARTRKGQPMLVGRMSLLMEQAKKSAARASMRK